jgi:TRAP-type C4-dicarboxylate transport system substrate-binding protein
MRLINGFKLAGTAGFIALASTGALAQTVLTASSWVPPTHSLTKNVLVPWCAEVEKVTQGRVKINVLAKAPMAAPSTFDGVRDGLVDVSYVTASYTPARHILPKMPELTGGGATAEINSVAYSRIHWKYFQQAGEYKGVKLLGVFTHGPGQMFTVSKPVKSLADLAGMKIRVGGGISEELGRALGASPFVKPAPESYELLSSGVADGTFFPVESIKSFKLEKVVKYATFFPGGFYGSAFGFFMNEDRWNKLSKQDQDAILSISGEYLARMAGKSWDAADKEGLEAMKSGGVTVINASPAFIKEVQAKAEGVENDWFKQAATRNVDGRKALAEFRQELKNVAAGK